MKPLIVLCAFFATALAQADLKLVDPAVLKFKNLDGVYENRRILKDPNGQSDTPDWMQSTELSAEQATVLKDYQRMLQVDIREIAINPDSLRIEGEGEQKRVSLALFYDSFIVLKAADNLQPIKGTFKVTNLATFSRQNGVLQLEIVAAICDDKLFCHGLRAINGELTNSFEDTVLKELAKQYGVLRENVAERDKVLKNVVSFFRLTTNHVLVQRLNENPEFLQMINALF